MRKAMKRWTAAAAALLLLGLAWGCSRSGMMYVTRAGFGQEVQTKQNLVFKFSKSVPEKNRSAVWDSTRFLVFEPEVAGRFRWTGDDELVFSPAFGFRPHTEYAVRLGKPLSDAADAPLDEEQVFRFHTPYLQIKGARAFWAKSARPGAAVEPKINLAFNYEVDPAELGKLLSAQADGKPAKWELLTTAPAETHELRLRAVAPSESKSLEVKIEIKAGLKVAGGAAPTESPLLYETHLKPTDKLYLTGVETEHSGAIGKVKIYCSQTPAAGQPLAQLLQFKRDSYWREFGEFQPTGFDVREWGIEVEGLFDDDDEYRAQISGNLRGALGGPLGETEERTFAFGNVGRVLQFAHDGGMYLARSGFRNLGLRVANIPEVRVRVSKIYANNIQAFMRQHGARYYYGADGAGKFHVNRYYEVEYFGDSVFQKTYRTEELGMVDGARVINLSFPDPKEPFNGVYVVEAASADNLYDRVARIISISDVGLSVKKTPASLLVMAHSLETTEPLANTEINLVSTNNQTVLTERTDGEGVARFDNLEAKLDGFEPGMITALKGSDFNYLEFKTGGLDLSRFDVGGKNAAGRAYEAFIYGPRNLFRPGEVVNFNAVVRELDGWGTPKDMLTLFDVIDPRGRVVEQFRGALDAEGSVEMEFKLPVAAVTGKYYVRAETPAQKSLGEWTFQVEEFMPDRLRVRAETGKPSAKPGEQIVASIQADYFYGAPAGGRNYEAEFTFKRKPFQPKGFAGFTFDVNFEDRLESFRRAGITAPDGKGEEPLQIPKSFYDMGLLEGALLATVFDETGRPVATRTTFETQTQDVFYGVKQMDEYVGARGAITVPVVATDRAGKALNNVYAKVQVVKYDWETVLERADGRARYRSQKVPRIVRDETVKISGKPYDYTFNLSASGHYELRVGRPGARTYVAEPFFAYGWGMTAGNAFQVETDGHISITTDKAEYEAGETAKVLFKTPFEGKLLVTLEREKVYEYRTIDTDQNAASLEFDLGTEHLPNVYITATLVRPLRAESGPFVSAHGFQSVAVKGKDRRLPVEIAAAKKSRSRTRQTVSIKTRPGARLTVAVVDEGILQLKKAKTPAPYDFFYARRALGVETMDSYAYLLPELGRYLASKTGGDGYALEGEAGMAGRANPLANKRAELVSYWSGRLKANANGIATFSFDLPQFAGQVRIMAVAYKGKAFGAAETRMTVADPLVISTALPRFLSPGDSLALPVFLRNMTEQTARANVRVNVDGPLNLAGAAAQTVSLSPKGEARADFRLSAKDMIGEAKITVEIDALGGKFYEETQISVRPASPLQRKTGGASVAAGQSKTLKLDAGDYLPGARAARLVLSKSPMLEFADDLSYLAQYPYGCAEQTISSVFPQLYAADLTKNFGQTPDGENAKGSPQQNIRAAIRKLQTLQVYDGGIALWPEGRSHDWTTVYAAHFLYEAKEAGYEVPVNFMNRTLQRLERVAQSKQTDYYSRNEADRKAYIARKNIYALYVLALNGRAPAALNHYVSRGEDLTNDCRYMLAAACARLGLDAQYRGLLPGAFEPMNYDGYGGYDFASPVRNLALVLNCLLETKPDHPQIGQLAERLSRQMKEAKYLNTQERAFGFLALGKIARQAAETNPTAVVKVDGRIIGKFVGKDLVLEKDLFGKTLTIEAAGSGKVYYFWEARGVSRSGAFDETDNLLSVRRQFLDRNGAPLGGSAAQNDLVVVKITLAAAAGETVRDVVISDLLPAGLELENPRIGERLNDLRWTQTPSDPKHIDYRDDRVNIFDDVQGGAPRTYYYFARAVSPGRYAHGPVSADAMYNGEYHSYHGAGALTIRAKEQVVN